MSKEDPLWVYRASPIALAAFCLGVAAFWLFVLFAVGADPRGVGIAVFASLAGLRLLVMTVVVFPERLIVRNLFSTRRIRRHDIAGFALMPWRDPTTGRGHHRPTLLVVTKQGETVEVDVLTAPFGPRRDRLKARAARLERWRVGAEPPPAVEGPSDEPLLGRD